MSTFGEKPVARPFDLADLLIAADASPCPLVKYGPHPRHRVTIDTADVLGHWTCNGDGRPVLTPEPKPRRPRRRVRVRFAWYDLWVGAYWDRRERVLYVCPLPTLLLEVRRG